MILELAVDLVVVLPSPPSASGSSARPVRSSKMVRLGEPILDAMISTRPIEGVDLSNTGICGTLPSSRPASSAILAYIEGFYNKTRRYSAIGYISPIGDGAKGSLTLSILSGED